MGIAQALDTNPSHAAEFNDWSHPLPITAVARDCDAIEVQRKSVFRMQGGGRCWESYEESHESDPDFIRSVWNIGLHYIPTDTLGGCESVHDAQTEEEAERVAKQLSALTGLPTP